jgi:hypothetical protein
VSAPYKDQLFESAVDDHIWGEVSRYKWTKSAKYVTGYVDGRSVALHKFIFEKFVCPIPEGMTVDHINSDAKLDNRLCNLRLADKRLQGHNRSKYVNSLDRFKGVSFTGHSFMIVIENRTYGCYETEEEAAYRANEIYFQLYGANAKLNVVPNTRTTKENRLPLEMITRAYIENISLVKELKHLIRVLRLNVGNGGPYNLEQLKGADLEQIRADILANKFCHLLGVCF